MAERQYTNSESTQSRSRKKASRPSSTAKCSSTSGSEQNDQYGRIMVKNLISTDRVSTTNAHRFRDSDVLGNPDLAAMWIVNLAKSSLPSGRSLDLDALGDFVLCQKVRVSKDDRLWHSFHCYLFSHRLLCIRRNSRADSTLHTFKLSGCINLKSDLLVVEAVDNQHLALKLSSTELPQLQLQFPRAEDTSVWLSNLQALKVRWTSFAHRQPATQCSFSHLTRECIWDWGSSAKISQSVT